MKELSIYKMITFGFLLMIGLLLQAYTNTHGFINSSEINLSLFIEMPEYTFVMVASSVFAWIGLMGIAIVGAESIWGVKK